jgi:hypothetical protein
MKRLLPVAAASFAVLTLAGCHVSHSGSGDKNNVSIATPFGSMNVKTHDGGDATTGLTVYPGATPAKDSDNNNAADVNLNFGNFHVGINAASYMTGDAPAKVIAFYKSDMAHFGDVIECQDKKPIGTPARTSQGLTCDDQDKNDIHTRSSCGWDRLPHSMLSAFDRRTGGRTSDSFS